MDTTQPLTPEAMVAIQDSAEAVAAGRGNPQRFGPQTVLALCATVEAQAAVIKRYKAGWVGCLDRQLQPLGEWSRVPHHNRREPMSPAEQIVVYGEVVQIMVYGKVVADGLCRCGHPRSMHVRQWGNPTACLSPDPTDTCVAFDPVDGP